MKSRTIRFLLTPFRILDEIRLVAAWDMTRQARRPSFFLMRGALAVFIAIQVILLWSAQVEKQRAQYVIGDEAFIPVTQVVFAVQQIFSGSIPIMAIGLILFCPALTSGSIAGDRERKIWHDLANSPLSGWSILMGKMVARLATVFAWILVAMPLWALLSLIGGLDPRAISLVMLGMFCYGWMFASFGMLASVATRRSRDALGLVTSFLCMLLLMPLVGPDFLHGFGIPKKKFDAIAEVAYLFNPALTLQKIPDMIGDNPIASQIFGFSLPQFFLIFGLSGPILTLIAGLLLRPLGRRLESAEPSPRMFAHSSWNRTLPSPGTWLTPKIQALLPFDLENYPMVVKEMRVRAGSRLTRNLRRLVLGIYFFTTLALFIGLSLESFREIMNYGQDYGIGGSNYTARYRQSWTLDTISSISAVILQYGLMLEAAGRMVMEKEQDTWTTLLSTPLEPKEILAGKAAGSFWNWRWTFVHFGFCLIVSTLIGTVHPAGLLISLIVWSILLTFMTVLGLRIGMNSGTHASAVSKCIGAFLLLQVGFPMLSSWIFRDQVVRVIQPVSLATLTVGIENQISAQPDAEMIRIAIFMLICFGITTFLMSVEMITKFDKKADMNRIRLKRK